jgi:3-oxoacyl-[acyl-carrier protein] reductase
MLLQNRNAVIYGAGGSLGGEIARSLAKEGATIFAAGNRLEPVEKIAGEIINAGGRAEAMKVDALNIKEVNDFIDFIIKKAGRIDISFNLISLKDLQGVSLVEMAPDDFTRPLQRAIESHFITGTAAGRVMKKQGSGVILSLTATPGGITYPNSGGFGPACKFIESFSAQLASELGPHGVRVVNIRSAGSPDSQAFKEAIDQGGAKVKEFIKKIEDDTMLKRMPLMKDIANTAVFLAGDGAAGITGVTVDVTCGTTSALNYKLPPIAFIRKPH